MKVVIRNNATHEIVKVMTMAESEIKAGMWVLAEIYPGCTATVWMPGGVEPIENSQYAGKLPWSAGVQRLDFERIKHRLAPSAAAIDLEEIVCGALNEVAPQLKQYFDDSLSGHVDALDFVSMVTIAAENWANDCYQGVEEG